MGDVTGWGIFLGLVAGVIVQISANWVLLRWQRKNAKDVLKCELELNLTEVDLLRRRSKNLRERISAGQVGIGDLFINMSGFDYSTLNPLVSSGHFHKMLGSTGVKSYLSAYRFFNNENAAVLTQMLQKEHEENKSLQFLDWLEGKIIEHAGSLKELHEAL